MIDTETGSLVNDGLQVLSLSQNVALLKLGFPQINIIKAWCWGVIPATPKWACFFAYFQPLRLDCHIEQIGPDQIEALYQYAKFQFECGNYSGAADFLYQYRACAQIVIEA